ncbi:MAG: mechanosensitive ion channel family protein [Ignavibacteriae bacterium]|nr:mechanosensitive ion channel family protein [Ignavibacteriota bacterium]MCB9206641.1 mechanosensitive ion channel family protein [Ignavibacteriales bacterium]MCB9259251.1 mechanosensitive ion channel family protein [Ignavibacteriales bacterium]
MEFLQEFFLDFNWHAIFKTSLRIILILILAWFVTKIIRSFLKRLEKQMLRKSVKEGEPPSESQKRIDTITRLLKQGLLLALWLTAFLLILNELGIEVGPIIAGAGIVGLAVGFGAQNLVRDIISGFFIILENQVRVGDVAIINGTGGLVEKIKFRTIVLRDLAGVVHIFPNGTITTLSNMTNEWSAFVIEIGVAYKENTDNVIEVMKEVGTELIEDEKFGSYMLAEPEIFGVNSFGDSAVEIKGRIKTKPSRHWEVGREYLRRIKMAFDKHGIEIPFPHTSLYFGEASKPIELKLIEKYKDESK